MTTESRVSLAGPPALLLDAEHHVCALHAQPGVVVAQTATPPVPLRSATTEVLPQPRSGVREQARRADGSLARLWRRYLELWQYAIPDEIGEPLVILPPNDRRSRDTD